MKGSIALFDLYAAFLRLMPCPCRNIVCLTGIVSIDFCLTKTNFIPIYGQPATQHYNAGQIGIMDSTATKSVEEYTK